MSNGVQAADALYASVDGVAYPLGREECLFQARGGGQTHVMTPEVLTALDAARPFRTFAGHAAAIAARIPALAGRPDAIERVLQNLARRGLLQRAEDYLRGVTPDAPPAAPVAGVFIRAGDDSPALARLLDSLRRDPAFDARAHRLVVLDRARDAAALRAHREAASGFAAATGASVEMVDEARASRIAQHLAKLAPEAGEAAAALSGFDLAVLLSAGRRLALLDDAEVLPLRADAHDSRALALGDAPLVTRCHADRDAALAAGEARSGDPFAEQLAWCGARLGTLLGAGGPFALERGELEGFEPSRYPGWSGRSRVLATCNGVRGDASDARALFLLEGDGRAASCADRARYLALLEAPTLSQSVAQPTALAQGNARPFTLDASVLLPPAGTDSGATVLFGVLCRALHPDDVVLQAPTTIGRVASAGVSRARLFQPETPPFAQYLADALAPQLERVRAAEPGARLQTLAALVQDLGDASPATRLELLHEYLRFRRSELIDRLQRAFAEFRDAPVHWQADVRELIGVNGRALTEAAPPRLESWPESLDEAGCAERLGRELRACAARMRGWPRLWRAAAELGDRLLAD